MNRICCLTSVIGILFITACKEKRVEQTYDEPVVAENAPPMVPAQTPTQAPDIHWHMPAGWQKESASDGITAMSYSLGNARLTITPLQGAAGGIEANVQRWRRQVGLPPFPDGELASAIIQIETGAGPAHIVKVSDSDTVPNQIFGSILPYQGTTWFVKMTGPSADLTDARWQEFQDLLKAAHPGGSH